MARYRWSKVAPGRVVLAVGLSLVGVYFLLPNSAVKDGVYDLVGLFSVAATVWGVRCYRPRPARPWWLITASLGPHRRRVGPGHAVRPRRRDVDALPGGGGARDRPHPPPDPAAAAGQGRCPFDRRRRSHRPGARARFRTFVACFCKRSSAFCTGLSPPPRSPRSDWKAIDSTPNRETQGPTPMITARLAVASDGSGRLLQRTKSRPHAGHHGVALAAPRKPRPNNA